MTRRRCLLVLALLAAVGCGPSGRRKRSLIARINPVRVQQASPDGMTLELDFEFENASRVALGLAVIDYRLLLDDVVAAEGKVGQSTTLAPRATTRTKATVELDFAKLRQHVPAIASGGRTTYVVQAVALLSTGERAAHVRLRRQGLLAIPSAAIVELARLEQRYLSPAEGRLQLYLGIRNPNAFAATLKELKGDVQLGGSRVAQLDLTPNEAIPPRGSTHLSVPLRLDFRRLGANLHAALASGQVDVRFAGTARVVTPYGEISQPIELARRMRVAQ